MLTGWVMYNKYKKKKLSKFLCIMLKNAAKIQNINWNKVFDRQKEKYLA